MLQVLIINIEILINFLIVFEGQVTRTYSKEGQYGDIFQKTITSKGTASNEGAKIKERCPKCGNHEMTFHTMQLRSADEGQTVFYSCPKCRYVIKYYRHHIILTHH